MKRQGDKEKWRQGEGVKRPIASFLLVSLSPCLLVCCAGCRQEMSAQPKYTPLQRSDFFGDGRSARPLVEGTVARGQLRDDPALYDGLDDGPAPLGRVAALVGLGANPLTAATLAPHAHADATVLPFEITDADMDRGRERFNIYCSVCHDRVGTGHGKIVERGYLRPPSYHTDRLRAAPVGHFYRVVTEGFGGMPDYREQIPPRDRWLIVAYVRALQLSQDPAAAGRKEKP